VSNTFKAQLLTPDGSKYDGEVKSATLPGVNGSFQILFNHAPIVSALGIGRIELTDKEGHQSLYAVTGGFVEMSDNLLTILAERAEEKTEIDKEEAKLYINEIKSKLKSIKDGREDFEVALKVAENRLKIAEL
jgi:F-type H+-transporting ATPase subunit epsilon